jgi:signal transduction histidine kinase/CheY-like chemotaxis protein
LPLDRRTSRLTWLYVSALAAVAALSITGQFLVQRALRQQRGDSTIVNIAGRQRMLSQKLTKAALAWSHSANEVERNSRAEEIRSTLALWQRSHQELQQGDAEQALPNIDEMVAAAENLLSTDDSAVRETKLKILLDREPVFLAAMDAAVFQLDREAQARVARLQQIEWLLLTLTLAVLIGEGFLVFRPAVKRIQQTAHDMQIAKEAAESANEQKTRFLATLSHELRNPLHAILGNTELALESELDPSQRLQVDTIQESARSLLSLVNDLLDLACIQAGKLRVQPVACDLRELSERAIAMVQPLAARKSLQLEMTKSYGDCIAAGDPLRVQQVLLNLLGNSVKFTERGSVRLSLTRREEMLRVEVRDTGTGIPRELQTTIFAAFMQIDGSSRREFSGVGLGLAISAGIIELLDGRIGVDSQPGEGSCFWFELPRSNETLAEASDQPPRAAEQPAPCRVLIADDDVINQRLLAEFLQKLGHTAIVAEDGLQAVERFQEQPFDLVLLDWHMPQLDGLDVARRIRSWEVAKQLPHTPIIAISAAADIAEEKVREAGVDDILIKPVSLEQLRLALSLLLKQAQAAEAGDESRWSAALARLQGNWELFREVATLFLEQLPDDLSRIGELAARQQFGELARAAHLLKGQAANFDASELIAAASTLEDAAEKASAARVAECLPRIQMAAAELQASLREVLTQLPAESATA